MLKQKPPSISRTNIDSRCFPPPSSLKPNTLESPGILRSDNSWRNVNPTCYITDCYPYDALINVNDWGCRIRVRRHTDHAEITSEAIHRKDGIVADVSLSDKKLKAAFETAKAFTHRIIKHIDAARFKSKLRWESEYQTGWNYTANYTTKHNWNYTKTHKGFKLIVSQYWPRSTTPSLYQYSVAYRDERFVFSRSQVAGSVEDAMKLAILLADHQSLSMPNDDTA